jgi:hypothetical protein
METANIRTWLLAQNIPEATVSQILVNFEKNLKKMINSLSLDDLESLTQEQFTKYLA